MPHLEVLVDDLVDDRLRIFDIALALPQFVHLFLQPGVLLLQVAQLLDVLTEYALLRLEEVLYSCNASGHKIAAPIRVDCDGSRASRQATGIVVVICLLLLGTGCCIFIAELVSDEVVLGD